MKFLIFFSLLTVAQICTAQEDLPKPVNSSDIIDEGIDLLGKELYEQAAKKFELVSKSDTNYTIAQLDVVISYFYNEDYAKVEVSAENMLRDFKDYRIQMYKYYLKSLIKSKKWEVGKLVAERAKAEYPIYNEFNVLEAVLYKESGDVKTAEKLLQTLVKTNASSSSAHYQLAKIAAERGQTVRAIISLQFAISCNNHMTDLGDAYDLLEKLCSNNYSAKTKVNNAVKNEFIELYELVESGIAQDSKYSSKLGLNYSINNQSDLIIDSIDLQEKSTDFWMNFYGPFLHEINTNHLIKGYILSFLRVNKQQVINALVSKHATEIRTVEDRLQKYLFEKSHAVKYPIKGVKYTLPYIYKTNGNLAGIGNIDSEMNRDGKWILFAADGSIASKLTYKAGEIIGHNAWYDKEGNITSEYTLVNDKINGATTWSRDNGTKRYSGEFKDGKLHGNIINYYKNGLLKEYIAFKDGKRHGSCTEINYAGDTTSTCTYKDGKLHGLYNEYYSNGTMSLEVNFITGKKEGVYKEFYLNGNLKKKGYYSKGTEAGTWEEYHNNGKLELSYQRSSKGKSDGQFYELFDSGDTSRIGHLKGGKLHGMDVLYSSRGKVYSKILYKKGIIKSYQYFDSLGTVLSEGKNKQVVYDVYGYKSFEGTKKGKKGKTGLWTYYHKNGQVSKKINYVKNKIQGPIFWYYPNTQLEAKCNFLDDERDGKYSAYYENGNLEKQGWYEKGSKQGEWITYNLSGEVTERTYYIDGSFDRFYTEYNNNGTLRAENFYEESLIQYTILYDTLGNRLKKCSYYLGSGKYKTPAFSHDIPFIDGTLKSGKRNGKFTYLLPNNKPSSITPYRTGTKHGDYVQYHYNSKVFETGTYNHGSKEGVWKTYYDDSKIRKISHFKNGKVDGKIVEYHQNGKKEEINHYDHNGNEHGLDTMYHENGTLRKTIPYYHGDIHGDVVEFDPLGKVNSKKIYVGNHLTSYSYLKNGAWVTPLIISDDTPVKCFYENGKVSLDYTLKYGQRSGNYKKLYSNGKTWIESTYEKGRVQGKYTEYYSDGTVAYTGTYIFGQKTGKHTWYGINHKKTEELTYLNGKYHGTCKYFSTRGKLVQTVQFYQGNPVKITKH